MSKPKKRVIMRDSIQGVTDNSVKRMAYKAGIRKMSKESREEVRNYVKALVEELTKEALVYAETSKRNTISAKDIINAAQSRGNHIAFSSALTKTKTCKPKPNRKRAAPSKRASPSKPKAKRTKKKKTA